MSTSIAKNMSKSELKSMLMKMGTSLDKDDHPKSYYEKLYLEKMNAKNKRTRSNNIFGREQILNSKRERTDTKDKKDEDEDDEDYVVEEEEENSSHQENEEINDDENLYANSEESDQDTEGKKKKSELKFVFIVSKSIFGKYGFCEIIKPILGTNNGKKISSFKCFIPFCLRSSNLTWIDFTTFFNFHIS